ncbi:MAG: DUF2099 family protein [Methanosphaera sp.]|nr:DUF2099 family protein [Methanosphaera sp.]
MSEDKHVIEALGKTRIVIKDGQIVSIDEPMIDYCPIFGKYHNMEHITKDDIRKNIEYRIKDFGMCTRDRKLRMDDMLSVGISEILRSNLKLGNIDCVVGACEGTGTLLMDEPALVQGVGGRVSGLVSTTPIPEIIEQIGEENILNPETAELNQLKGLEMAIDKGYKNIAITIIPSEMIREIREYPLPDDVKVYIFVAHNTAVSEELAKITFDYADIVTACASREIIKLAQIKKPYYYGKSVPIFAVSENGRKFLDARLKDVGKKLSINEYPLDEDNFARKLR